MNFTIITGLSGAGRSTALRALEDMGFFCSDNIPPELIPIFAKTMLKQTSPPSHVAISVDMRMGDMFESIYDAINEIKTMDLNLDILFLDAQDETLVTRFKFTRRIHPVSGSGKIIEGIWMERDNLQKIKEMADNVLDTTTYSDRQLASVLEKMYAKKHDNRLLVSVITFGYKRGIPIDADMVFDMRFLPNPYYIPELRAHSGLNEKVKNYVLSFEAAQFFLDELIKIVNYIIPCYIEQDKKQLVIGIGCTGGMHRSVAMGTELYERLLASGHRVTLEHRDMNLESNSLIAASATREL